VTVSACSAISAGEQSSATTAFMRRAPSRCSPSPSSCAVSTTSASLVERARREKHLFGGALRQAGIVAAAGIYALEHHVERLADDHTRARRLAEGLADAGIPVDLEQVETNFVQIDVAPLDLRRADALERVREAGVGLSATIHPTVIRAVVHLGITDEDIEHAVERVPGALGVSRPTARRA
jgi:threonine aldolase